ncbi:MAG: glycosyltransferase family 2 protein [Burkholderiales bacterium]
MKVGIVVPVYSNMPYALLQSIQLRTEHDISWYLFFHGDDQRLATEFMLLGLEYRIIHHLYMINRGLSRSWNEGICEALFDGNDIVLVINDDIEFIENGFNEFISYLDQNKGFSLAFLHGEEPSSPCIAQSFACFAIGYDSIRAVGFFDENIMPAYYEDIDYDIRVSYAKIPPPISHPSVLVKHGRSVTIAKDKSFANKISSLAGLNRAYMMRKWWGDHYYEQPFNSNISLKIEYNKRDYPYGPDFDRTDLGLFKTLTTKQEALCYFADDSCLFTHAGEKTDGYIITTGRIGYFLYGPYCHLEAGDYELTLLGEWVEVIDATLDICSDIGQKILFKTKLPSPEGKLIKITFELLESTDSTEIRIEVSERDQFKLQGYKIKRV